MLDEAEKQVLIISAYLIPSIDLQGAIARAVKRGVNVRILTNSLASTDVSIVHAGYALYADEPVSFDSRIARPIATRIKNAWGSSKRVPSLWMK